LFAAFAIAGLAQGIARPAQFGFGPDRGLALLRLRARLAVDRLLRPLAVVGFGPQARRRIDIAGEFVVLRTAVAHCFGFAPVRLLLAPLPLLLLLSLAASLAFAWAGSRRLARRALIGERNVAGIVGFEFAHEGASVAACRSFKAPRRRQFPPIRRRRAASHRICAGRSARFPPLIPAQILSLAFESEA
jgi:hypothetical protein